MERGSDLQQGRMEGDRIRYANMYRTWKKTIAILVAVELGLETFIWILQLFDPSVLEIAKVSLSIGFLANLVGILCAYENPRCSFYSRILGSFLFQVGTRYVIKFLLLEDTLCSLISVSGIVLSFASSVGILAFASMAYMDPSKYQLLRSSDIIPLRLAEIFVGLKYLGCLCIMLSRVNFLKRYQLLSSGSVYFSESMKMMPRLDILELIMAIGFWGNLIGILNHHTYEHFSCYCCMVGSFSAIAAFYTIATIFLTEEIIKRIMLAVAYMFLHA